MLFQSQGFVLVFLPAVLIAWALTERHRIAREWVLAAASVAFYAAWDVRFLPLILGQTVLAWAAARTHGRIGGRLWLALAIAAQLAALAVFKYLDFFTGSMAALIGGEPPVFSLILPIGISFYTFQIVSYLVDLRAGRAPLYGFRQFSLYVLFFPQLIAGPIVRHDELMPQLERIRPMNERGGDIAIGLLLFVFGFFAKVFLADPIARAIDPIFAGASANGAVGFGAAWSAALGFSFQLLLDFSAYTNMALGLALLFGLRLPQNFDRPYRATSLRDFWRRWHMTLSRFLRDYVYIPLGGSRAGPLVCAGATMATMALCGLWHGAGWTFVAWGVLHGAGLVLERGARSAGLRAPAPVGWALTMSFVLVGWVLFRATDFTGAGAVLAGMAGAYGYGGGLEEPKLMLAAAALLLFAPRAIDAAETAARPVWPVAVTLGLAMTVAVLEVGKGQAVTFVYFQF